MADRKKPPKKKHTKKIKKTKKKDTKGREKKYTHDRSGQSLTRRKSSNIVYDSDSSTEEVLQKRNMDLDSIYKKTDDYSLYEIDEKKSTDFVRKKKKIEPIRKKSIEFSRNLITDVYQPDNRISIQEELNRKKSLDKPNIFQANEPVKKKSTILINPTKNMSYKQREEYYEKMEEIHRQNKLLKRGQAGEHNDYQTYKRSKSMRNSRIGLAAMLSELEDREEAGEQSRIMVVKNEEGKLKQHKFDFVDYADYHRTHLKLAFVWMEICGITHLSLMIAYGYSENFLSISNYDRETGFASNILSHFIYGSAWIIASGNAIIMFRIFNKSITRNIKYFHVIMHTVSYLCCVLSLYAFYLFWKDMVIDQHNYSMHAKIGLMSAIAYLMQWLIGLCVYTMEMFRQKFRIQFYHYHSYIGFVVFFLAVTTMCTGLVMEEKFSAVGYSSNRYVGSWLPRVVGITGVIYAGAVLFIIVYPYFDFAAETEPL